MYALDNQPQVHTTGGIAALVLVVLMGPRLDRFSDKGVSRKMERQSVIMQACIIRLPRSARPTKHSTDRRFRWVLFRLTCRNLSLVTSFFYGIKLVIAEEDGGDATRAEVRTEV